MHQEQHKRSAFTAFLLAIGVVFGNIASSPLFVMKTIVRYNGGLPAVTEEFVLGALSLIIWTLTILATGCMMGLMAWISRGIEASSAIHIVNNMVAFYADGLGIGAIGSEVSTLDLAVTLIIDAAYVAVLLILRKKGLFDRFKRDDAAEFNAKVGPKYAKRNMKNYELHWKPGVAGPEADRETKAEE